MTKKVIATIYMILCVILGNAQSEADTLSVSGNILMSYDGLTFPLLNISVELGENRKESTDSNGFFYFNNVPQGAYELRISIYSNYTIASTIEVAKTNVNSLEYIAKAKSDWANKQIAEIDIKNSNPRLLLVGGIAPTIYTNQRKFERKYKIKYYDYGCLISVPEEKMEEYNKAVFLYLDAKYGNKWRESVRPDVLGLKN